MRPETLSEKIEIIIMTFLPNSAFSYNFKHFEQNKVKDENWQFQSREKLVIASK